MKLDRDNEASCKGRGGRPEGTLRQGWPSPAAAENDGPRVALGSMVPDLDDRIKAGRFKAGTKDKYRQGFGEPRAARIGPMQVMEVDGDIADKCLTKWFTEGKVAGAGMGFPKTHSPAVVAMVCRLREEDPTIFTYDAIATLLRARFPEEKERGCTRHTVAGILKRERGRAPVPAWDPKLKEARSARSRPCCKRHGIGLLSGMPPRWRSRPVGDRRGSHRAGTQGGRADLDGRAVEPLLRLDAGLGMPVPAAVVHGCCDRGTRRAGTWSALG